MLKKLNNILSNNINYVIIDNNIIKDGIFIIKTEKSINSNNLTNRLYHNDNRIKLKNTKVNYTCKCGKTWEIYLKKYLIKKTLYCNTCKEMYSIKRENQSLYMKNTFNKYNKIKPKTKNNTKSKKLKSNEFINKSNINFNNETDLYKEIYYDKHLTNNQFNKIKDHIFKVNNNEFNNHMLYYEHLLVNNQNKYSSYIYDKINNKFVNFNNIEYFCENCNNTFKTSRPAIEKIKNKKILCKTCSLCNKTFKIRNTFNILNEKIIYQSKPELYFIEFCNKNNIYIQNGHNIEYFFDNKKRKYRVDFFIPNEKILLEIKDNHIWHKEQLKNGKWDAKLMAVKNYAIDNNYLYKLVFVDELNKFLTGLLKNNMT